MMDHRQNWMRGKPTVRTGYQIHEINAPFQNRQLRRLSDSSPSSYHRYVSCGYQFRKRGWLNTADRMGVYLCRGHRSSMSSHRLPISHGSRWWDLWGFRGKLECRSRSFLFPFAKVTQIWGHSTGAFVIETPDRGKVINA